jgi:hypothetical protein
LKEIKKNGEESKMLPEGREMQIAYEKCELEHRLEKKEYKVEIYLIKNLQ